MSFLKIFGYEEMGYLDCFKVVEYRDWVDIELRVCKYFIIGVRFNGY